MNDLELLRRQQESKIQHRDRLRQVIDFASLQVDDKVRPTDIDGIIDYKGICWIILEYKYDGAPLPDGQQWVLENLTRRLEHSGVPAMAIVADHTESNPINDIEAGYAAVRAIYTMGKWQIPKHETLVKDMVRDYIKWATARAEKART